MALDSRGDGMSGELFSYGENLQAFESGVQLAEKKMVMVGGLSDGLLACPYVPELGARLAKEGWSLVQPVLRSSYCQFGFRTLEDDVADLEDLVTKLKSRGLKRLALCGHSTGSQICAHFVQNSQVDVSLVVLQAPVSDRETDDTAVLEERKKWLNKNTSDEMLPRAAFWAPITGRRFFDLHAKRGADDYFSSDLTDQELQCKFSKFSHVTTLLAYSGADEYAPPSLDKSNLIHRICNAMKPDSAGQQNDAPPRHFPLLLPEADHALYRPLAARTLFLDEVIRIIHSLS